MRGYKSFDATPHPGDLKEMIEIYRTQNTVNANGYPSPTDVLICSVWASAIDAGNQAYRAADAQNTEAVVNFTIRYRDDIVPGMWVKFKSKRWNITTLGEYAFSRQYLGLKASLADGISG